MNLSRENVGSSRSTLARVTGDSRDGGPERRAERSYLWYRSSFLRTKFVRYVQFVNDMGYTHTMNKSIDAQITDIVASFAYNHRFTVVQNMIDETECRSRSGEFSISTESYMKELNKCVQNLRRAIEDTLDEHEMYMLMGVYSHPAPKHPKVDDSWVQLAEGKL